MVIDLDANARQICSIARTVEIVVYCSTLIRLTGSRAGTHERPIIRLLCIGNHHSTGAAHTDQTGGSVIRRLLLCVVYWHFNLLVKVLP
jgi:hypothetical protein